MSRDNAIASEPFVRVYKVLPPDVDDYAKFELMNVDTGEYILDGEATGLIKRTNIRDISKLIGKVIKITTTVEIVE